MIAQNSSRKSQKGAGIVEYLLILVMTVAIVSALAKGVGAPLRDYFKENVIGIVGCMLRVGQFPPKAYGLCKAEALKLSMEGGNGGSSTGGGNGGSGSGSDSNSGSGSNTSSQNKNSVTRASSSGSGGSGSDSSSGSEKGEDSSRSDSGRTRFVSRKKGSSGAINESSGDGFSGSDTRTVKISEKNSFEGDSSFGLQGFKNSSGNTVNIRKIKKNGQLGESFSVTSDKKEMEKKSTSTSSTTTKALPANLVEERVTENSFFVHKPKKRSLSSTGKEEKLEFSFFGMIKWGLIIAIIAMLVFFTFSQLNSIRKGMD